MFLGQGIRSLLVTFDIVEQIHRSRFTSEGWVSSDQLPLSMDCVDMPLALILTSGESASRAEARLAKQVEEHGSQRQL